MNWTSLTTIYDWFKTRKKPTEAQFRATWNSFWHKSEKIPVAQIDGIDELLNDQADADLLESHINNEDRHLSSEQVNDIKTIKDKVNNDDLHEVAKTGSFNSLKDRPVFANDGRLHIIRRAEVRDRDFISHPPSAEIAKPSAGDVCEILYIITKYKSVWLYNGSRWVFQYESSYKPINSLSDLDDDIGIVPSGSGVHANVRVNYLMESISRNRSLFNNITVPGSISVSKFQELRDTYEDIEQAEAAIKSAELDVSITKIQSIRYVFIKKSIRSINRLKCLRRSSRLSVYRIILYSQTTPNFREHESLSIRFDVSYRDLIDSSDFWVFIDRSERVLSSSTLFENMNMGEVFIEHIEDASDLKSHVENEDLHLQNDPQNPFIKQEYLNSVVDIQENGSFKVGGSFDNFYPIVFKGITSYSLDLEIYRVNVHQNGTWRGSLSLKIHNSTISNNGHSRNNLKMTHYWRGDNKLCRWVCLNGLSTEYVVYLRGDTNYQYKSSGHVSKDLNTTGVRKVLDNNQYTEIVNSSALTPVVSGSVRFLTTPDNGSFFEQVNTPLLESKKIQVTDTDTTLENLPYVVIDPTSGELKKLTNSDWQDLSLITGATATIARYRRLGNLIQIHFEDLLNDRPSVAGVFNAPSIEVRKVVSSSDKTQFGTLTVTTGSGVPNSKSGIIRIEPFNVPYSGLIEFNI